MHQIYEYFYPPSIDLNYEKNRRFFCLQKIFQEIFLKHPQKNALPFQTSEGVNSNPDMNYLRLIESEDSHMKEKEFKNVRWCDIYYL